MQNLWINALKKLEKRINRPSFNTWIRPTKFLTVVQQDVSIGVPDEVFVYWLGEYYVDVIVEVLSELLGFQPNISFVVMDEKDQNNEPDDIALPPAPVQSPLQANASPHENRERQGKKSNRMTASGASSSNQETLTQIPDVVSASFPTTTRARPKINPQQVASQGHCKPTVAASSAEQTSTEVNRSKNVLRSHNGENHTPRNRTSAHVVVPNCLNNRYTFNSYVVGGNNRFAHAAALAVAEQVAINYNPLFIYGGVGLGKTHLLHAVGNHVAAVRPHARILYLSSEQFVNEMVFSIREDHMARFRDKYRNIDLLLIDDIQFIARKERTQEEFFHTFNTLYQARKQIVLTSDCPPKKIPTIAEQLRSRFEWGLIADIQTPDLETRIAILKKKAELQSIALPDEVAIYIASKVKSNIRELEGSLSKIRAYAMFNQHPITVELAKRVLHDMFDATPKRVTIELVQQVVANHYHIELTSMTSSERSRKITLPRQIAMYLARELTNSSLPDIGRNFGGRDHTTVLHACKKVEKTQMCDLKLKENIIHIRNLIQA